MRHRAVVFSLFSAEKKSGEHDDGKDEPYRKARSDVTAERVGYGTHRGRPCRTAEISRKRKQSEHGGAAFGAPGACHAEYARPHDADKKADQTAPRQPERGNGRKDTQGISARAADGARHQRGTQAEF